MASPHGTISRYTNGKCRCDACRLAKKVYEGHRLRGDRKPRVYAARSVRKHVRFLLTHGWGTKTLGDKVGVDRHTIWLIANGTTRYTDPKVAEKLLATHIMDAPHSHGGLPAKWKTKV